MHSKYRIKVTKEMMLELESELEAQQVAEIIADRESGMSFAGNLALVYCDYELVGSA